MCGLILTEVVLKKTAAFFHFFRNFKQRGDELELKIELIKLHNKGFVYFLNCRVSRLFLPQPLNLACHPVFLKSGEKECQGYSAVASITAISTPATMVRKSLH